MLLRLLLLLLWIPAYAQETPADVLILATVHNSARKLLPEEEVHFVRKDNGALFKARSDAQGKFELRLPAGAPFQVRIRTLTDTTNYTEFETPPLRRDGYALRALSWKSSLTRRAFTHCRMYFLLPAPSS
ncbi:MAG: hypothetical protein EOP50_02170 [Sphingobacteriales bacterium]|nr:MAG: hypothetical protein EOP50_02170 [Sphingobacteriales bacterium]